jgi:hypothetical protein
MDQPALEHGPRHAHRRQPHHLNTRRRLPLSPDATALPAKEVRPLWQGHQPALDPTVYIYNGLVPRRRSRLLVESPVMQTPHTTHYYISATTNCVSQGRITGFLLFW